MPGHDVLFARAAQYHVWKPRYYNISSPCTVQLGSACGTLPPSQLSAAQRIKPTAVRRSPCARPCHPRHHLPAEAVHVQRLHLLQNGASLHSVIGSLVWQSQRVW